MTIKELIASKLRPIGDAIREKDGSTELIPIDDMPQAIRDIQGGGGLIEVSELPEVGEEDVVYKLFKKTVAVPNTGYVERVYLNKSLSFDEVNAICTKANNLVANETLKVNCILSTKDNSKVLTVLKFTNTDDSTFNVILYPDWLTVIWSEKDYTSPDGTMTCKKGWNIEQNYLEINAEVVAVSEDDIPTNCGTYNDQLTELFSLNGVFETTEEYFIYTESKIEIVPNTGYVDMVYYNYNLTIEETNNILSQLTYVQTPLHKKPIAGLLLTENEMGIIAVDWGDGYQFLYLPNLTGSAWVQLFNSSTTSNNSLYGWNSFNETEEAYKILGKFDSIALSNYNGIPVGTENDKLSNLISTTPFVESGWKQISGGFKNVDVLPIVGNENYTYILKNDKYEIYTKTESEGIVNLVDYLNKIGGIAELVGVFDSRDKLPTSNIKVSSGLNEIYFYYVKNDDVYVYGTFGSNTTNAWSPMSDLMFPFGGEITSTLEITATETLYVLKSEGIEKYYRYTYIFELNMYQVDNGKIYNFTEIAKEQGLKVNAEAVTSLPSEPIESDLSTTFYVYYVKGDNAYVYNQSIFGGWVTVSTLFELPYNGEVSSLDEMTTNGLYVLYNDGYSYKELFIPSGTLDITNNGNTNVKNYAYVNVNVSAQPVLQQKTIDPIKSSQDITPDSGYDGLSKVTIRAIPDNYIIPSGTITVDSYSGPVSFDVTNYEELALNLPLYGNEVELLGNKLTCISNKADEYTYIKVVTYDARYATYYDRFFNIKDAGTRIETIQDDLEIRFNSQSTHNSLKVGSSSGGSEYAVLTKKSGNNKFSMNVSEDITIYLTYE